MYICKAGRKQSVEKMSLVLEEISLTAWTGALFKLFDGATFTKTTDLDKSTACTGQATRERSVRLGVEPASNRSGASNQRLKPRARQPHSVPNTGRASPVEAPFNETRHISTSVHFLLQQEIRVSQLSDELATHRL